MLTTPEVNTPTRACFWCKKKFLDKPEFIQELTEEISLCNKCRDFFIKKLGKETTT